MNYDNFASVDMGQASRAAMAVIDKLQDFPSHEQVAGLCVAMLAYSEAKDLPLQDIMVVTKNLVNYGENKKAAFRAVKDYIENET